MQNLLTFKNYDFFFKLWNKMINRSQWHQEYALKEKETASILISYWFQTKKDQCFPTSVEYSLCMPENLLSQNHKKTKGTFSEW